MATPLRGIGLLHAQMPQHVQGFGRFKERYLTSFLHNDTSQFTDGPFLGAL